MDFKGRLEEFDDEQKGFLRCVGSVPWRSEWILEVI